MRNVMRLKEIIAELEKTRNTKNVEGMARFGITPDKAYGSRVPVLRKLGKRIGKDHTMAKKLWDHGYRETQIIASIVAEPEKVTEEEMEMWLSAFSYWEIVDQFCMNLFIHLPDARERAVEWSKRQGEFQRRTGYALMACLAWKRKDLPDNAFDTFYPELIAGATDGRNNVKKGISWALRNLGKRNMALNKRVVDVAREIEGIDDKAARWVAKDVLKELTDKKQLERIKNAKRSK
jgi:3-methyladenine DNA glycosylase AlkD